MTQAHPICGCPTQIVAMFLKSQFLPRMQIKHLRRQRQHIQDRVRLGSSVRFLLQGHCEYWRCVNRRLHFRRGLTCLDLNFVLSGKFDGICGMAWCSTSLFHLWTVFVLQWKVWWMLARSPSSPSTLEIKSMESLTQYGGVTSAHYTGDFSVHELGKHQLLAS